jgi:hypothetical protein
MKFTAFETATRLRPLSRAKISGLVEIFRQLGRAG